MCQNTRPGEDTMSHMTERMPSWMGSSSKESALPMGCKVKIEKQVTGAGELSSYPDTVEQITKNQEREVAKIRRHKISEGERE